MGVVIDIKLREAEHENAELREKLLQYNKTFSEQIFNRLLTVLGRLVGMECLHKKLWRRNSKAQTRLSKNAWISIRKHEMHR